MKRLPKYKKNILLNEINEVLESKRYPDYFTYSVHRELIFAAMLYEAEHLDLHKCPLGLCQGSKLSELVFLSVN